MSLILPRRRLLLAGAAAPLAGLPSVFAQGQAPALITRDAARPAFPSGVQSGDVQDGRGIVWARSDRAARMWVEWSTTASFAQVQRVRGPHALEATDFSARLDLTGLPAGQHVFYRVQWEDLASGALSEPMSGHLRSAPAARADIRF